MAKKPTIDDFKDRLDSPIGFKIVDDGKKKKPTKKKTVKKAKKK